VVLGVHAEEYKAVEWAVVKTMFMFMGVCIVEGLEAELESDMSM
jgi:hypothetical protein